MVIMNMIFWILLILGFSSSLVSSQSSDSCSSSLSVSHLIPFNTSSFNCFSAWSSEGFIMRTAATDTWSFVLSAPDSRTYVSVGFSADGFMVGSSAVAGWVSSSGVGIVRQYYLEGTSSSSCPPGQGTLHLTPNSSLIVLQSSRLYLAFQLTGSAQPQPYLIYAGVGFVLGAAGVLLGFGLGDEGAAGNADTHRGLGVAIFVFGILQVLAFLIRPGKASKVRRYWNWYHHYVGRAAVACAIANVFVGLSLAHESSSWSVFYGIFIGVWAFACVVLEVKLRMSD
ncbi:Cytochrome b561 and DOMON domain-containing protein [Ananas comosus]|uniref:Cytochrome b561 and DOMON domain-containing protein n=1 Tax=Ananas comosus TaxID=4615 RepID=A0A199VLE4_ANACO|nr:Cytochrome b561 and DOMON domain-containing protein [Ananas comosus]